MARAAAPLGDSVPSLQTGKLTKIQILKARPAPLEQGAIRLGFALVVVQFARSLLSKDGCARSAATQEGLGGDAGQHSPAPGPWPIQQPCPSQVQAPPPALPRGALVQAPVLSGPTRAPLRPPSSRSEHA